MKPKTRSELRVIISQLYDYLKTHDDLLDFESESINAALRALVIADCHLAHLKISHSVAVAQKEVLAQKAKSMATYEGLFSDDFPF